MDARELSEAFARIETKLEMIEKSQDKVLLILEGNGNPKNGLIFKVEQTSTKCAGCQIEKVQSSIVALQQKVGFYKWLGRATVVAALGGIAYKFFHP